MNGSRYQRNDNKKKAIAIVIALIAIADLFIVLGKDAVKNILIAPPQIIVVEPTTPIPVPLPPKPTTSIPVLAIPVNIATQAKEQSVAKKLDIPAPVVTKVPIAATPKPTTPKPVQQPKPKPPITVSTPIIPVAVSIGIPGVATFEALAQCESGGRWNLAVGSYLGGLQFSLSTWRAYAPAGYPSPESATKSQQIYVAQLLWQANGWAPWPSCSAQLGLR